MSSAGSFLLIQTMISKLHRNSSVSSCTVVLGKQNDLVRECVLKSRLNSGNFGHQVNLDSGLVFFIF